MDIGKIHDFILDVLRKQRLATPTHATIDRFLHRSQMEIFADECADLDGQEENQALSPFKLRSQFTYDGLDTGVIPCPADYAYLLGVYAVIYDSVAKQAVSKKIQLVSEDQLANAQRSQIRKISAQSPIGTLENITVDSVLYTGIRLYPNAPVAGYIHYLKNPIAPVYVYTQVGRVITYDSATSTQLLWNDMYQDKIISKTLMYLAEHLDDAQTMQFGQLKDQTTKP